MAKDFTFTGYNKNLKENARNLRKNMTPQEQKLWYLFLKDYKPRFNRQKIIASYIADFYCSKAKLVIEVDGGQHYTEEGTMNDENRTSVINTYGVKVIRFSNNDVNTNFYWVCEIIDKEVKSRLTQNSVE